MECGGWWGRAKSDSTLCCGVVHQLPTQHWPDERHSLLSLAERDVLASQTAQARASGRCGVCTSVVSSHQSLLSHLRGNIEATGRERDHTV